MNNISSSPTLLITDMITINLHEKCERIKKSPVTSTADGYSYTMKTNVMTQQRNPLEQESRREGTKEVCSRRNLAIRSDQEEVWRGLHTRFERVVKTHPKSRKSYTSHQLKPNFKNVSNKRAARTWQHLLLKTTHCPAQSK